MKIIDAHHHGVPRFDAVTCLTGPEPLPEGNFLFSVGLHPWFISGNIDDDMEYVSGLVHNPRVVAIGETGIDKLRGAPLAVQCELFERHIGLAVSVRKPLVVHSVRSAQEVISLLKRNGDGTDVMIHGFRGGKMVARMFLDAGCHLSLGEHFNREVAAYVPSDMLHAETDESLLPVEEIVKRISEARGDDYFCLAERLVKNNSRLFGV